MQPIAIAKGAWVIGSKTVVLQLSKNTVRNIPKPVHGLPNLAQNQTLSMLFRSPAYAFLTVCPASMVLSP